MHPLIDLAPASKQQAGLVAVIVAADSVVALLQLADADLVVILAVFGCGVVCRTAIAATAVLRRYSKT